MRNNSHFDLFYQTVKKQKKFMILMKQSCLENDASQTTFILKFVSGHEETSDAVEPYYPTTVREHFKAIYFETINAVHKAVKERLE